MLRVSGCHLMTKFPYCCIKTREGEITLESALERGQPQPRYRVCAVANLICAGSCKKVYCRLLLVFVVELGSVSCYLR